MGSDEDGDDSGNEDVRDDAQGPGRCSYSDGNHRVDIYIVAGEMVSS